MRNRKGLIGAVVVTALLALYVWQIFGRARLLLETGEPVGIVIGIGVLVLPLLVIGLIAWEFWLAITVQKMADQLAAAGSSRWTTCRARRAGGSTGPRRTRRSTSTARVRRSTRTTGAPGITSPSRTTPRGPQAGASHAAQGRGDVPGGEQGRSLNAGAPRPSGRAWLPPRQIVALHRCSTTSRTPVASVRVRWSGPSPAPPRNCSRAASPSRIQATTSSAPS
ncbi:hypothetical protein NKG05_00865 [Oerskovia sp. M15]